MSSPESSVETEARYDRDVALIVSVTVGATVVAVVIVVCLGCMYYYRCIKFRHLILPAGEPRTKPSVPNLARSSVSTEHEKDNMRVFTTRSKKLQQANVKLPMQATDWRLHVFQPPTKVIRLYEGKEMVDYDKELSVVYDHISEEHDHYLDAVKNISETFARRWRVRTLFRSKKRDKRKSKGQDKTAKHRRQSGNRFVSQSDKDSHIVEEPDVGPDKSKRLVEDVDDVRTDLSKSGLNQYANRTDETDDAIEHVANCNRDGNSGHGLGVESDTNSLCSYASSFESCSHISETRSGVDGRSRVSTARSVRNDGEVRPGDPSSRPLSRFSGFVTLHGIDIEHL